MKMQRLIHAGFAALAIASTALPAFAYTWPDFDFDWYLEVGKTAPATAEETPAPRAGFIWAPSRYEAAGAREEWVAGHWVKDEFAEQVAELQRLNRAPPAVDDARRSLPIEVKP